ncbi:MAG: hypothetical protein HY958_04150 [Bacteroidia bacterium]|nr:hypothetical protein [Bacteroidia bacterium]
MRRFLYGTSLRRNEATEAYLADRQAISFIKGDSFSANWRIGMTYYLHGFKINYK